MFVVAEVHRRTDSFTQRLTFEKNYLFTFYIQTGTMLLLDGVTDLDDNQQKKKSLVSFLFAGFNS